MSIIRGLFGIVILLLICYAFSRNRKAIDWRLVGVGMLLQFGLALLVLNIPLVRMAFDGLAQFFVVIIDFTEAGSEFVLGKWPNTAQIDEITYKDGQEIIKPFQVGYMLAFKILPIIVFFSALTSVLYYLGILQLIIKGFAWIMVRTMRLTGAESLAAAANVFIGQTEAPLVVKPYLESMSRSEILCLMTGGMATIAGSVFASYVGFLGGEDPVAKQQFARHLLTASIISAPAAIVCAKILLPEEEKKIVAGQKVEVPKEKIGNNLLDAISIGTTDGLKLAINVGAMLLVFTAFVAMLNYILINFVGSWTGLNEYVIEHTNGRFSGFNMEYILGIVFAPFAWILGVANKDILLVGQLLGLKTTLNEFFAYATLGGVQDQLEEKSLIIVTYALCGFANFASIGIQIGGIGAIAPKQRTTLTRYGLLALLGGTIAAFLTAAIAGMFY